MTGLVRNGIARNPWFSLLGDLAMTPSSCGIRSPSYKSIQRMDVINGDKSAEIVTDAPGYEVENIDVSVDGDTITVSGSRTTSQEDESAGYIRRERGDESFSRSFTLDDSFDRTGIRASLKNGILRVSVPKKAEKQRSAAVKVKVEC